MQIVRKNPKGFPLDELLSAMNGRSPHRKTIEKDDVLDAYSNVLRGRVGKEYLMLLDILLHRGTASDWAGKAIVAEDAAIHHIFPREFLKDNGETRDEMINCLANLTFISPEIDSEIGDSPPDEYLAQYLEKDEETLKRHFIPTNKRLWTVERFEDFLDARLKLMWNETAAMLGELSA